MVTFRKLAAAVMAHAHAHYGEDGWDMIAECMEVGEIAAELESDGITDERMAINSYAESARLWAEMRDNARGEF
jgi:hypothetical protein